ncbi:MAG: hypothetical protein AB7I50_14385, partial [Vicinamibacterales bacterium]
MKRLAWMLLFGLVVCPRVGLAYDGPGTPITYDQLINGIRVVMTSQPVVLSGSRSRFTMTAYVPVEADTVGRNIRLEIRRIAPVTQQNPSGYVTIGSCLIPAQAGQVGQTVAFSCWTSPPEAFLLIGSGLSGTASFYPYVERPSDVLPAYLIHDGINVPLQPTVGGLDLYEPNNTLVQATNLGSPVSPFVATSLVSFEPDYYKIVIPANVGSVVVRADFWIQASNVDLQLLDSFGTPVTADGNFTDDFEQLNYNVSPGETYYILADQVDTSPGYYNLTITFDIPDLVTVTSGPSGTPNPVAAGGIANLSVTASDTLGHSLNYEWSQVCSPQLSGLGTFSDRYIANPTWTAPSNPTPSGKNCFIRVTVNDGLGHSSGLVQYTQTVGPDGDIITITSAPSGTPNPATGPVAVALSVAATDSFGHPLSYLWTANCPGVGSNGTFSPNANVQSPTWNAPANNTGSAVQCIMTVQIADGQGLSQSASYLQTLNVPPHTVTITQVPSGAPDPVASGGAVAVSVTATDSLNRTLTYAWSATCAGPLGGNGSFANGTTAAPTWTAPANLTGSAQTCSIEVVVTEPIDNISQTASYTQTVNSVANTITLT